MEQLIATIRRAGGWPLVVGGAVRDMVLGHEPKDVDFEVYGLNVDALIAALREFGEVHAVGASFGVLKLHIGGYAYDISVPRRESKAGSGHRGFIVACDPYMPPQEAAARRDFTWNAMAYDPSSGVILDFFGGQDDLAARRLRHTSPAFAEDPLRVLRAMQFAARLDLSLDPTTAELCRSLAGEYATLAVERIWGEWEKWALKGIVPSAGLRVLRESDWIVHYPDLAALIDCPQEPAFHPEGDVWIHTGFVADAAAHIAERDKLMGDDRITLILAALCHDLGKPTTTMRRADGRIVSPGHAEAGDAPTRRFLASIGCPARVVQRVRVLVREHMTHTSISGEVSPRQVRRLAERLGLGGEQIAQLARLVEADYSGRPPLPGGMPEAMATAVRQAGALGVTTTPPPALLAGRHLVAAGYLPGPSLGVILRAARTAQLDGVFEDEAGALRWALKHFPHPAL